MMIEIILVQKCLQPGMTWKDLKEVTGQAKERWERRPDILSIVTVGVVA